VLQPIVPPFTPLNKIAYNWMILNHQLERMWKELAMVQFQVLYLAEGNKESNDNLSESSVCPSEDSKQGTADYRREASVLDRISSLTL
jgi:hypothetical protein